MSEARYTLGLDIGGTFTDVVLVAADGAAMWTAKTASVPRDPSAAFFDGVDKVLAAAGVQAGAVSVVLHGSTVATNAVLERRWVPTGMLVTEGFKYVLEIGRAEVPRKENLYAWQKPERPIPPRRIREVAERVRVDGTIERPLDEASCRAAIQALGAMGVEAVAVVFLHSYLDPAHERRAGEIVQEMLPGVEVSLSCDVLPVFREYERSVATALNAGVQPRVGRYVARLQAGLTGRGIDAPLLIMKSNGGVFSPAQAARQSIEMALSGPAAGAMGAAGVAAQAGFANTMTVDMGGTSADVCLIRDGTPAVTTEGEVGGFPLGIPIVDIHTIGAGGGSIAQVSAHGGLTVGPGSAGADPGPACYARGGTEPTVTDANLVLGRIPPHLLDGEIDIDVGRARAAIDEHVADPLSIDTVSAARGIVALVNNNMVGALKVVSVEKGYNPADFTLCAFGGAGPVHGGELMSLLGAARLLVPRFPGILCAIGLLSTDQQYDFVRTHVQRAPDYDPGALAETYRDLEAQAARRLDAERVEPGRRALEHLADLRYARQGVELTVPFPEGAGTLDRDDLDTLVERFHDLHERLYTFSDREAQVEIINLRVKATGAMDRPVLPQAESASKRGAPSHHTEREVIFDAGPVTVPVYRREALQHGHFIHGPAVVDQLDTTTVIYPRQRATVDRQANLLITSEPC